MIREVPQGTSIVDANVGQTLQFAVMGGGTTGYRWEARKADGIEVERFPPQPKDALGGASRNIFQVTPLRAGNTVLQLELRAPWDALPAETRQVVLRVR